MNVKELIQKLMTFPAELPVYSANNSDGFEPTNRFDVCDMKLVNIKFPHYTEPVVVITHNVL